LKDPAGFPLTLKPALGNPMLVTESSWTLPTLHRAEGSFLVSAYGSLTGSGRISSSSTPTTNGRSRHRRTATTRTPSSSGRTPNRRDRASSRSAWLARLGYVQEAKPVVVEQRSLDDLWTQRLPLIAEEAGFDPNRDTGSLRRAPNVKTYVDPLAYFVGPVPHHLRRRSDEKLRSPEARHADRPRKADRAVTVTGASFC
jgi:hypothetical protein